MEAPSQPQVFIVGEEFITGQAGNAEIDLMLGHDTVLCGDKAIRGGAMYEVAPDYCTNEVLTLEKLAEIGVHPLVLRTEPVSKKRPAGFVREWVSTMPFGDGIAITKPFPTRSEALACALWFALADK